MKTVVITGSTRGIGYGLAESFLRLGCTVAISGRIQGNVDDAAARLGANNDPTRIAGFACDVTSYEQVRALWEQVRARFGTVDIWINNAGTNAGRLPLWQVPSNLIQAGVETNLTGAMFGSVVAIRGMLAQGSGAVYNMEGLGSNGRKINGLALYGTTKYGLAYLTDALARETRNTPVIVAAIRPGMVVTGLLTKPFENKPDEWRSAKNVFNLLAERVETVTPWIAERVLANTKSGIRIQWLTRSRMVYCVARAVFTKRDLFR
jgi:NAD(P)-dependent dehydrogenase (short-subunit alcohol dehydrogenase family)